MLTGEGSKCNVASRLAAVCLTGGLARITTVHSVKPLHAADDAE